MVGCLADLAIRPVSHRWHEQGIAVDAAMQLFHGSGAGPGG